MMNIAKIIKEEMSMKGIKGIIIMIIKDQSILKEEVNQKRVITKQQIKRIGIRN